MTNGWNGADPTPVDDGATAYYELATRFRAEADITITHVRVYSGPTSGTLAGRHATLWTDAGASLGTATLVDSLPSGWSTYALDAPEAVLEGSIVRVSYGTRQWYAATAGGYPALSGDGNATALGGFFAEGLANVGTFPTTGSASFYGIDIVYTVGITGNTAPSVTLAVSAGVLAVAATATVDDDDLTGATYAWKWGDGAETATSVPTANHTYAAPGVYPVLVTVTDAGGLADSAAAVALVRGSGTGVDVDAVALDVANRLKTISGLAAYPWQPGSIVAPCAVVLNPDPGGLRYHETGGRGMWRMTLPVVIFIGRANERVAQKRVRAYLAGAGAASVRSVLEDAVYASLHTLVVTGGGVDGFMIGGVEYLVALFDLDITGSGA